MKSFKKWLLPILLAGFLFSSCEFEELTFDDTLLFGKWQSGTEFYRYEMDGTGAAWDTADDVTEAEAQGFTWTLVQSELTHIHVMEMGGSGVPKVYTVTQLTATSLRYRDDFGKSYAFTKVSE